MGAMMLPKRMKKSAANNAICRRLGIRLDGVDTGRTVVEYDVEKKYIITTNGDRKEGVVEPYWREPS